jgi:serine/threonine-protein kinase
MRLGSCEVLSLIGAGGMGKVYKARDTRLGREVAIKVLPEGFAGDPERMARLEREARILASLNHPNIASIFSLEEGGGVRALVMEYVDGPALSERMARGPMPVEEALPIARQIAEALAYAHERGIIHRDLKPANVKLTTEGAVKVLDFGLAKALEGEAAPAANPETSPTLTAAATRAGVILGTAAYMSPEQARGKPADKRADIWAFGVVLFEMLAGKRLFDGENVSETLASVLKEPIDWLPLPAGTPPAIRRLLRRSLERDRKKRLHDIADALLEIDEALEGKAEQVVAAAPRRAVLPWALAGLLALVAIGLGVIALRRSSRPVEQPLIRLDVDLGPNAALTPRWGPSAVLSPDGTRLVYIATGPNGKPQLATRTLDRREATLLSGTEGARDPFFSPDGQWVGFFADGKLKKIAVTGGAAANLGDSNFLLGASWGEDGNIVAAMGPTSGLWRIPSAGGPRQLVTEPDVGNAEDSHRWPQVLPGGRAVLFTAGSARNIEETGSVVVQSLKDKRRKVLWRGGYYGRYVPSGHLVYVQQGTLFAVRFDPETWELTGTPAPVVEEVASAPGAGSAQFDFSRAGTLIYASGGAALATSSLMWLDGAGKPEHLPAKPGGYVSPRLSPDGKRLALIRYEVGAQGLWVYEWRGNIMNRLTSGQDISPAWSPDSKHIALYSERKVQWIRADGGKRKSLTDSKNTQRPYSFSPDGKRLAFDEFTEETRWDIWTLPLEDADTDDPKPGKPELFLRTRFTEAAPAFSPDGRWLAHTSNESGSFEVYVRPFPDGGAKWQVSSAGGRSPAWSRTRPELFYLDPDNRIMVATYAVKGDVFTPQTRRVWSAERLAWAHESQLLYDLAPDGNRVIALMPPPGAEADKPQTRLTFLLNFFDELRRRVPAGGK